MILGTQMERHIGKRLGIPCAVISAPVHVQDFPARYSPQMGWEGANVIFDTWVHPLVMGLEEHLLRCSARISSSTTRPGPATTAASAEACVAETEPPGGRGAPEERISGKMKDPEGTPLPRPARDVASGCPMPSGS
jgi:light-independent protochlorophyllide reductase subunit B